MEKNYFYSCSSDYSRFRPDYPVDLFRFLESLCRDRRQAWDCGAGTGQATAGLAGRFEAVFASDISFDQIAQAAPRPGVYYFVGSAGSAPIRSASLDLVVVAQALHWFDLDKFFQEVRRILKPGGVIGVWCYRFPSVDSRVDAVLKYLNGEILRESWPQRRRLVDQAYQTIAFPFREVATPDFRMEEEWNLDRYLGYLGTWSAVHVYRERKGADPLIRIRSDLLKAWRQGSRARKIKWSLHLRAGHTAAS